MDIMEDMECEPISPKSEESGLCELNSSQPEIVGRPDTPESNLSGLHVQDDELPGTPPNTINLYNDDSFRTPNVHDSSFINRVGIEKARFRANPRLTSTPLYQDRLSTTLPSMFAAPNRSHLKDYSQCRSAEIASRRRLPESAKPLKLGPNGVPLIYINPFTPDGKLLDSKIKAHKKFKRLSLGTVPPKFNLNDSSGSEIDLDEVPLRSRLREFNVSRFHEEFVKLEEIGKGVHGCVYKCVNRMNGCLYAVKKTLKPIQTGIQEKVVRNEVYAHGVLFHQNIVRNFSCWKEEGYVFIQNEYCGNGNLETYMETNTLTESVLRNLLVQIASALQYMHQMGLAHMDIKPGNIFLCIENVKDNSMESDGGFSDEKSDEITFKLGDLGHVSRLGEDDPEEGDCRYLPREIIQDNFSYLDRADIFALGLTVYEAAGGGSLPKNGEEWQDIRNGNLKYLDAFTNDFNEILKKMIAPSPVKRPTAAELVSLLKPSSSLSVEESMYIDDFRRKNTRLEHTALATNQYLKVLFQSTQQMQDKLKKEKAPTPSKEKHGNIGRKKGGGVTKTRVVGRKTKRSSSTTLF